MSGNGFVAARKSDRRTYRRRCRDIEASRAIHHPPMLEQHLTLFCDRHPTGMAFPSFFLVVSFPPLAKDGINFAQFGRCRCRQLNHTLQKLVWPSCIYIVPSTEPRSLSPPSSRLLNMESTTVSQPFVPRFETARRPSAPGLSASIWAPQPQPSDNTWFKAIESISRANDDMDPSRPEFRRATSHPARRNPEDVFGPVGFPVNQKAVGAIGDGRKKLSPEYEAIVSGNLLNICHQV